MLYRIERTKLNNYFLLRFISQDNVLRIFYLIHQKCRKSTVTRVYPGRVASTNIESHINMMGL